MSNFHKYFFLINLFLTYEVCGKTHRLCKNDKSQLIELYIKKDIAHITSKNAKVYDFGSEKRVSKVDLNNDGFMDLSMYLGACGTGGCMEALFLNCGDNKNYLPLIGPEYFSHASGLEIDLKSRTKVKNESWAHVTYKEYWQKTPYTILIGYRYQFNGEWYELQFTDSEYRFLIKKALLGKRFAIEQLIEVAYRQLLKNPNHPSFKNIKDSLLDPKLMKIIKKNSRYKYLLEDMKSKMEKKC